MTADPIPPVALITGAARRIGRGIAELLARDGFAVAIHHRDSADEAEATVAAIRSAGGRAAAFRADLAREADMQALLPAVAAQLGPVGLLVNNASTFERDEALTATRASWDAHLEANLRAPFVLTQALAAGLPGAAGGLVINMLDQRVWALTPHFTAYTVSKFALWGLTQSLALALAPRIRVNGIGPGPTLPSPRQSVEQFERQCRSVPLRRGTSVEEICAAVEFIRRSPSLTGQMIALDGGQHLGWAHPPFDGPLAE